MSSSYSVIHRFTPPTCTLEILAKSFFWRRSTTENCRFELRFDDPRLPDQEQASVRGDRAQLELFREVVTNYIQAFLRRSPSQLPLNRAPSSPVSIDEEFPNVDNSTVATLPSTPLRSRGLLAHELFFESLAVEASVTSVKLSTLQLFDLAEALEAYTKTATVPKPYLNQSRRTVLAVAGVAVLLAVGIPVGIELLNSQSESDEPIALQEIETQPPEPSVEVLPPVPPAPTDTPMPSPSLPAPLASPEQLPPPPPVSAPNSSQSLPAPPNVTILPAPQAATPKPTAPPSQAASPPFAPAAGDVEPSFVPAPDSPKLPNLPPLQPQPSDLDIIPGGTSIAKTPDSPLNSSEQAETTAAANNDASSPSLRNIPQVAEVKQYFQKQWQPPESLKETLEYRLVLDRNGSIKRIIPLGQAARIYLDRTGMPLMGESFVSPLSVEATPQIRLVLSPDGTVKTFLEA